MSDALLAVNGLTAGYGDQVIQQGEAAVAKVRNEDLARAKATAAQNQRLAAAE